MVQKALHLPFWAHPTMSAPSYSGLAPLLPPAPHLLLLPQDLCTWYVLHLESISSRYPCGWLSHLLQNSAQTTPYLAVIHKRAQGLIQFTCLCKLILFYLSPGITLFLCFPDGGAPGKAVDVIIALMSPSSLHPSLLLAHSALPAGRRSAFSSSWIQLGSTIQTRVGSSLPSSWADRLDNRPEVEDPVRWIRSVRDQEQKKINVNCSLFLPPATELHAESLEISLVTCLFLLRLWPAQKCITLCFPDFSSSHSILPRFYCSEIALPKNIRM